MSKKIKTEIDKDKSKSLILSIVLTIALVVGVPLIVYGASNSLWIIMIVGIVCTVAGFYCSPIAWVHYSNVKAIKRVVDAVLIEKMESVTEISKQLQISPRVAKDRLTTAIQKRYIMGYIFDGENLTLNQKQIKKKRVISNHCPNCGGKMEVFEDFNFCPYCNTRFEIEK